MYIDIRDFKANTTYESDVISEDRCVNLSFTYKTKLNKLFIYRKKLKPLTTKYTLMELQSIDIVKQKTGFGYKNFFRCPYCGKMRQHLYFAAGELVFACRSCIDTNVYKYRTSLYDNGNGECLIYYKVAQIFKMLKTPIQRGEMPRIFMYNLLSHLPERPKYMRWGKYALSIKRLYFLYWMWGECITGRRSYTATEINEMLEKNNTEFVYDNMIYPEYYKTIEGL